MLKAVIFDMDGVLIDSEPLHARAAVLALHKLGVDITIEYCYGFIGSTTVHMLETMICDFNLKYTVSELLSYYKNAKDELIRTEGHEAIPYTRELIIDLHKHGVKLAIASSSSVDEINDVVTFLKLSEYFHKLVSGTTVSHPKPAPDVFQKAMEELEVNSDECIIIEDSYNGVCAGNAAGVPVVGFVNTNSGNQDLSKACILVEGFDEVDYDFLNKTYLQANNLPVTIALTNRLIIRELTVENIPSLYQIYQNPEITKYQESLMDNDLQVEIERHTAYINNVYHFYGYGLWGVFLKENNQLIGRCGIQNAIINEIEEIELGYLIDPSFWRKGYARECIDAVLNYAFNELSINRIVSVIDSRNIASLRLAEKVHMVKESEFIKNERNYYLYKVEESNYL